METTTQNLSPDMLAQIEEMKAKLRKYEEDEEAANRELATFDVLDYEVFCNQDWDRFKESHSQDIIVYWPDGHQTQGLATHIEDMIAMFVYAPDTNIKVHPVRFGRSGFTCVTGIMTGTFTEPMPIGDGKFIEPTGKSFSIPMCTVGHWENGVMVEEWLYWDNATYMKQIGVGQ
ncbi:MAG: ester cyclase [Armatimonadota bacterium]